MLSQNFLQERMDMVARQLHRRGIVDARVLAAFEAVPRHWFVPESFRDQAYEDCPLPIGHGQTISQPFIVAYMLQMLDLNGTERVLEVGTGSNSTADVPQSLLGQLTDPGRMILPVGGRGVQHLELWRRSAGAFACETLLPVAFVPLRGRAEDRGAI